MQLNKTSTALSLLVQDITGIFMTPTVTMPKNSQIVSWLKGGVKPPESSPWFS